MTYIGNKIASVPKDEDHNLGHGKAEYIYSLLRPKAIPTVNESMLTLNAINRIVKLFNILLFSSSFDLYISIESIRNNTNVNIFIFGILYLKAYPMKYPNRGIKKWNIPTISDVLIIVLLFGLVVPKDREREKASMLNPIPVKKYIRDILSPYIFYSNILSNISFMNDLYL